MSHGTKDRLKSLVRKRSESLGDFKSSLSSSVLEDLKSLKGRRRASLGDIAVDSSSLGGIQLSPVTELGTSGDSISSERWPLHRTPAVCEDGNPDIDLDRDTSDHQQIGRASCRERV